MFGRTVQLNVVKKRKKDDEEVPDHPVVDVEALANITGRNIVMLVAAYFALDTARKVVVNRLSK